MKLTSLVTVARNTTASSAAAAVTMPPGLLEADGDGMFVVVRAVVFLLDARQQEDLVVHRQAERDAEHQDRRRRDQRAGRGEVDDSPFKWPSWKM